MKFNNTDTPFALFWFRRDLRLHDNKGLFHALNNHQNVIPLFIFDTDITDSLPVDDARIHFIYSHLTRIQKTLQEQGKTMLVKKGKPEKVLSEVLADYSIEAVYTHGDHEPYGIERDEKIRKILQEKEIPFHSFTDHLLFEKEEVVKDDGTPYHVYTPYGKKCKSVITDDHLKEYPSSDHVARFADALETDFPTFESLGFKASSIKFPEQEGKKEIIKSYDKTRDYPGRQGTTRLGVHLRFGTISIRRLASYARKNNDVYFNELLWREFYAMILWHYPRVVTHSFKPGYDNIPWRNNTEEFERWKEGKTGYPLVDAGMRELATTGYMHNRVRMVTASFLTKHLLIDWRWGEAWFAEKLLDYELSSNNGGWQWSAGSGCDAAPYFRIFNPSAQQKKFDSDGRYVAKWVKEAETSKYVQPVVDHKEARERCLRVFKEALSRD